MANLLVAAKEGATNTLLHGGEPGIVRVWLDGEDFVCEIADAGRIDDPLVGRRSPDHDGEHGRGMWLINQLCDLAELRPGLAARRSGCA